MYRSEADRPFWPSWKTGGPAMAGLASNGTLMVGCQRTVVGAWLVWIREDLAAAFVYTLLRHDRVSYKR